MDSDLLPETAPAKPPGEWMRLELLGHRTRYGLVTEVERFGVKMARLDIFRTGDTAPCLTEFYAANAFYGIGSTSEERARDWADNSYEVRSQSPAALLPPPPHDIEHDNDGEVV